MKTRRVRIGIDRRYRIWMSTRYQHRVLVVIVGALVILERIVVVVGVGGGNVEIVIVSVASSLGSLFSLGPSLLDSALTVPLRGTINLSSIGYLGALESLESL